MTSRPLCQEAPPPHGAGILAEDHLQHRPITVHNKPEQGNNSHQGKKHLSSAGEKMKTIPLLPDVHMDANLQELVNKTKQLYIDKLGFYVGNHKPPAYVVAAPGRVNLIGEHTDYTGGFVLPFATDKCTVIYGTGFLHTGKGAGPTTVRVRMLSDQVQGDIIEERRLSGHYKPPLEDDPKNWVDYVVGTIIQYMPDLPGEGSAVDIAFAVGSNLPIGAGVSSSASLEVAVATFLECFLHDMAFSSSPGADPKIERALRCQTAENEWARSPCGIMDQLASSAAEEGHLMLIDCKSLSIEQVLMKRGGSDEEPLLLVANSNVTHDIADGEYGKRRKECHDVVEAMQQVPLYHVTELRDANLKDCDDAKEYLDETLYKRARHVVTENQRTKEAKIALKMGLWDRVGELMNQSHLSLKDDFEVSCEEVDFLVETAQNFDGVYGSRMTGGGFGGCTVTLVKKSVAQSLTEKLKADYKAKFNKECDVFVTRPSAGARVIAKDKDCSAESDFFK